MFFSERCPFLFSLRELRGFPGLDDRNMSSRGIELESLDQRSIAYVAHYLKLL